MEKDFRITELNQLLKGTNMGIYVFEDLKQKLNSMTIRKEFDEYLFRFKTHARALEALIETRHGDVEDQGIQGMMIEWMNKIKNMMLVEDKDVVNEAIDSIKMAQKALYDFVNSHFTLDQHVQKICDIMRDDYGKIFFELDRHRIEFSI